MPQVYTYKNSMSMLKIYKIKAGIKIIIYNMNIKAKKVAKTERCSAAGRKTNM